MTATTSITLLQSQFMLAIEQSRLDREQNGGAYTRDGLNLLREAAQIQLRLSDLTSGAVSLQHQQTGAQLVRTIKENMLAMGMCSEDPPAQQAAAVQSAPQQAEYRPAPEDGSTASGKTANGELEGFDIRDYIVKPGEVSLEDAAAAAPEVVELVKACVYNDFARKFPNLAVYDPDLELKNRMFYGPPGSGKTFICRGLATYLSEMYPNGRAAFFLLSCSQVLSKYVGTTEHRIREIFKAAEAYDFAVICIDEAEALGGTRWAENQKGSYMQTLLELIDGVSGRTNAMVILATNRPELIDSALVNRVGHVDFIDYPQQQALIRSMRKKSGLISGLGATPDQQDAMIGLLTAKAAERRFSFRNMNVLYAVLQGRMCRKLLQSYPDGSREITQFTPLTEAEITDAIDSVNSTFNPLEYDALLRYHREHSGKGTGES